MWIWGDHQQNHLSGNLLPAEFYGNHLMTVPWLVFKGLPLELQRREQLSLKSLSTKGSNHSWAIFCCHSAAGCWGCDLQNEPGKNMQMVLWKCFTSASEGQSGKSLLEQDSSSIFSALKERCMPLFQNVHTYHMFGWFASVAHEFLECGNFIFIHCWNV